MRQEEALEHLRGFMLTLQKYRSNVSEEIPDLSEETKGDVWPWVFGNKCPLPMLSKVVSNVEDGGKLRLMDYYNFMIILHRFCPEIKVVMEMFGFSVPEGPPSPVLLVQGWEDESR